MTGQAPGAAAGSTHPAAVVVDTNLWGKGTLNLSRLKRHADRLGRAGIEVWVPTQVILEWASHAAQDAAEAKPALEALEKAGLLKEAIVLDVEDAVTALTTQLEAIANLRILEMTGPAVIAGLRDQILGTGPGEVRGGVKTGAVDSSWVRDAIAVAGESERLVFLTKDAKDVYRTADSMGVTVKVLNEGKLYSNLFGTTAAPYTFTRLVTSYLDNGAVFPVTDIMLDPSIDIFEWPLEVTDVSLLQASLVGVSNVQTVGDSTTPTPVTVQFQLELRGDVQVTGHTLDHEGQLQMVSHLVASIIEAPCSADIFGDEVREIVPAESATAYNAERHFSEQWEALEWLAGAFSELSGVTVDETEDDGEEKWIFRGPEGVVVEAQLVQHFDEWTLVFDFADSPEITCMYDVGARVWDGKESFDVRPPYYLSASEDVYSIIRRVWRKLHHLE